MDRTRNFLSPVSDTSKKPKESTESLSQESGERGKVYSFSPIARPTLSGNHRKEAFEYQFTPNNLKGDSEKTFGPFEDQALPENNNNNNNNIYRYGTGYERNPSAYESKANQNGSLQNFAQGNFYTTENDQSISSSALPPPPPTPPISANSFNDQFQNLLERQITTEEEKNQNLEEMSDLMKKFKKKATKTGKMIIEMSEEERKACSLDKGIAGGQKFLIGDIFYKFAKDDRGIYKGDRYAQKAAGHELRSMIELTNLRIPQLHLPLACIVDHLGFRLLAISRLPINNSTLIHGSDDGGRTFKPATNPEVRKLVQQVGIALNLQPHRFKSHHVYLCVDLEVHQDIIDAARLWPPVYESEGKRGSIFYNLMRPEFLRTYPYSLNADALSSFGQFDKGFPISNQNIATATHHLKTKQCEQAAEYLIQNIEILKTSPQSLVRYLHNSGVNVRYLSIVLENLNQKPQTPDIRYINGLIVIEVIARSLKNVVKERWRECFDYTESDEIDTTGFHKALVSSTTTGRPLDISHYTERRSDMPKTDNYLDLSGHLPEKSETQSALEEDSSSPDSDDDSTSPSDQRETPLINQGTNNYINHSFSGRGESDDYYPTILRRQNSLPDDEEPELLPLHTSATELYADAKFKPEVLMKDKKVSLDSSAISSIYVHKNLKEEIDSHETIYNNDDFNSVLLANYANDPSPATPWESRANFGRDSKVFLSSTGSLFDQLPQSQKEESGLKSTKGYEVSDSEEVPPPPPKEEIPLTKPKPYIKTKSQSHKVLKSLTSFALDESTPVGETQGVSVAQSHGITKCKNVLGAFLIAFFFGNHGPFIPITDFFLSELNSSFNIETEAVQLREIIQESGNDILLRLMILLSFSFATRPDKNELATLATIQNDVTAFCKLATLYPSIKDFPFEPRLDLFDVFKTHGLEGLSEKRKELRKQLKTKLLQFPDEKFPPQATLLFEQLSRCCSLISLNSDLSIITSYLSSQIIAREAVSRLLAVSQISFRLGCFDQAAKKSFDIVNFYCQAAERHRRLDMTNVASSGDTPPLQLEAAQHDELGYLALAAHFFYKTLLFMDERQLPFTICWVAISFLKVGQAIKNSQAEFSQKLVLTALALFINLGISKFADHVSSCYCLLEELEKDPEIKEFYFSKREEAESFKPIQVHPSIRALTLQKKLHPNGLHEETARAYLNIGRYFATQGFFDKAEKKIEKAESIFSQMGKLSDLNLASVSFTNGLLLFYKQSYEQAIEKFRSTIELFKAIQVTTHLQYYETLLFLCQAHIRFDTKHFPSVFDQTSGLFFTSQLSNPDIIMLILRDRYSFSDFEDSLPPIEISARFLQESSISQYFKTSSGLADLNLVLKRIETFRYLKGSKNTKITFSERTALENQSQSQVVGYSLARKEYQAFKTLKGDGIATLSGWFQHPLDLENKSDFVDHIFFVFHNVMPVPVSEKILSGTLTFTEKIILISQVAAVIECVHQQGYVILNLTSASFLFTKSGDIRLANLSLAEERFTLDKKDFIQLPSKEKLLSKSYPCPEFNGPSKILFSIAKKIDIFYLGYLAWELESSKLLPCFKWLKQNSQSRVPIPPTFNKTLSALIQECWKHDPVERPTAKEVVQICSTIQTGEIVAPSFEFELSSEYMQIVEQLKNPKTGLSIENRNYRLVTYHQVFEGRTLVTWLVDNEFAKNRKEAVEIGNVLFEAGVFFHVTKDHTFKDEQLFYRFVWSEQIENTHKKQSSKKITIVEPEGQTRSSESNKPRKYTREGSGHRTRSFVALKFSDTEMRKTNLVFEGLSHEDHEVIEKFRDPDSGLKVGDKTYLLTLYPRVFEGKALVDWLVKNKVVVSRESAVEFGNRLFVAGVFTHVLNQHKFQDSSLFYRFIWDKIDEKVSPATNKTNNKQNEKKQYFAPYLPLSPEREAILKEMKDPQSGIKVADKTYRLSTYHRVFEGREAVDWLINHRYANSRKEALELGNQIMQSGAFDHVANDHPLKDEVLFYRFSDDEFEVKKKGKNRRGSASFTSIPLNEEEAEIAMKLKQNELDLPFSEKMHHNVIYSVFEGKQFVDCLLQNDLFSTPQVAINYGNRLIQFKIIEALPSKGDIFFNPNSIYYFLPDEQDSDTIFSSLTPTGSFLTESDTRDIKRNSTGSSSTTSSTGFNPDPNLQKAAQMLNDADHGIQLKNKIYHFQKYRSIFYGKDMVDWLIKKGFAEKRPAAVEFGNRLMEVGVFSHVSNEHRLKDQKLFYRLNPPTPVSPPPTRRGQTSEISFKEISMEEEQSDTMSSASTSWVKPVHRIHRFDTFSSFSHKKIDHFFEDLLTPSKKSEILQVSADLASLFPLNLHRLIPKADEETLSEKIENSKDVNNLDGLHRTPLFVAAQMGDFFAVQELFAHSFSVEINKKCYEQTPLFAASMYGHTKIVKFLIQKKANLESSNDSCKTPLFIAAENGHLGVVKTLIKAGANVNTKNSVGNSPLLIALERLHQDIACELIHNGADIGVISPLNQNNPLHLAAKNSLVQATELLIQKGANVNVRNGQQRTPLHMAAENDCTQTAKILLDQPQIEVDAQMPNGISALYQAARVGSIEIFENLIEKRANIHIQELYGYTPLLAAAAHGHEKIIQILISSNVDINQSSKEGFYPLLIAAQKGHLDIVRLLIRRGAMIDKKTQTGSSALIFAAQEGHLQIVKELVQAGASVATITTNDGTTALYEAARGGHCEVVEYLVKDCGADPNQKTKSGRKPLVVACLNNHISTTKVLLRNGARANDEDPATGSTPLMIAIEKQSEALVKYLILLGDDPFKKPKKVPSLVEYARKYGTPQIVKMLEGETKAKGLNKKGSRFGSFING